MNISPKTKETADACRFCWMCRHVCPVGNATGQERNTARARALGVSLVLRGAEPIDAVIDNLYECTLCGACSNNCVTGWDPKRFVQEIKTQALLDGCIPPYVARLLAEAEATGSVYGKADISALAPFRGEGDTLFFVGQTALHRCPQAAAGALSLMREAGVRAVFDADNCDSGAALWFLTGATRETQAAAEACAGRLGRYKTVVVYDPVDLQLFRHEYRAWGIGIAAEVTDFRAWLLSAVTGGALAVKKSSRTYTVQDHYSYARELDDTQTIRSLVGRCGRSREMLLAGKEADFAGSLLMREYMPEATNAMARRRWAQAQAAGCRTLVTESPDEYVLLRDNAPENCRAITTEEMVAENL